MKRLMQKAVLAAVAAVCSAICQAQTLPVVVQSTTSCATSVDGSVVGVQNPLRAPVTAVQFTGTLPSGNYYVEIAWYDAAAHITLVSPEVQVQLTAAGGIQVSLPTNGKPAAAVGMKVYIGTTSGGETLQGSTTGNATFTQSTPLVSGAAPNGTNTTVCEQIANDAGWPTGTGYNVALIDKNGNSLPGYPMQWQLLGPGNTYNLNQGIPYYNGTVQYPIPILARPYNHAGQSLAGPLSMTGYNITQLGRLGVGTSVPGWGVDAEQTPNNTLSGMINASNGYLVNGGAGTSGQALCSDGSEFDTPCTVLGPGSIPVTTKGDLWGFSTTSARVPVGSDGSVLTADSTQTLGLGYRSYLSFAQTSAPTAGAGIGTLWMDVGAHRWEVNPNNAGVILLGGISAAGTPNDCLKLGSNGIDYVDAGNPCQLIPSTQTDYYWTATGCTTGTGQPVHCVATTTLPGNMPDASYQVFCQANVQSFSGSPPDLVCTLQTDYPLPTTSGSTLTFDQVQVMQNGGGGGTGVMYLHAHHN